MQKQKKQFLVMILILAVCILAYIGLQVYTQKQDEKEQQEAEAAKIIVTEIDTAQLTEFSYTYGEEELTFVKEDGTWYYKADKTVNIDQDQIATLLSNVTSIEAQDSLADCESLQDYGLDSPAKTITLTVNSETVQILLGDTNSILSQVYLKLADKDQVYLVETEISTAFEVGADDLTAEETDTEEPAESGTEE